jgi:hypothetical protein
MSTNLSIKVNVNPKRYEIILLLGGIKKVHQTSGENSEFGRVGGGTFDKGKKFESKRTPILVDTK